MKMVRAGLNISQTTINKDDVFFCSGRTPGRAPEDRRYVVGGHFLPRTTSSSGARPAASRASRESLARLNKDLGISEPGKTPTQDASDR